MGLTIRKASSGRDVRDAFALPDRLHRDDPAWVAPLAALDARRAREPLRRGELALFLAERDGRLVGTVAAIRDDGFVRSRGEPVVWFGYFACEDDPGAARALLDAAAGRARAWGGELLRGPRNLSRFEHVGVAVEGFRSPPPFLQSHHPPYYRALLEAAGLSPHHDVLAYETPVDRELPPELAAKAAACAVPGLVVRGSSRRTLRADLDAAHAVLDAAYRTVPDVAPMPLATWRRLGRTWLAFADPALLQLAFVGDRPIAFAACLPELNEALVRAHGSLLPLGWARILLGLRRVRSASFKLIGVLPEYRGTGVHARLIAGVVAGVRAAGYTRLEAGVIDERNAPMRAVVEHAGMTVYRRYRFFERGVR